jgi:hypothetical protein
VARSDPPGRSGAIGERARCPRTKIFFTPAVTSPLAGTLRCLSYARYCVRVAGSAAVGPTAAWGGYPLDAGHGACGAGPLGQIFARLGLLADRDDPLRTFAEPLTGQIVRVTVRICVVVARTEISAVILAVRSESKASQMAASSPMRNAHLVGRKLRVDVRL